MKTLLLVFMLVAVPVAAQQTTTQRAADYASYATVGTTLALDGLAAWKSDHRAHDLQLFAARVFVTVVWADIAKGLVHRTRPDGSDDKSFYSMHTALAFSTLGGPRLQFSLPLAIGTGTGRVVGKKHYVTDVLVGAAVGALTSRIREVR